MHLINEYPLLTINPTAFNHSQSNDAEAEYDRLRDLARQEAAKRSSCFDKVRHILPPRPLIPLFNHTTNNLSIDILTYI